MDTKNTAARRKLQGEGRSATAEGPGVRSGPAPRPATRRPWWRRAGAGVIAVTCSTGIFSVAPLHAQHPQAIVERAEADFEAGRIAESVAGFDRLAALDPTSAPWLWQRGIGLYYLGRFGECAEQFAAYHRVNPGDVDSAVWHFACVARGESLARAREVMLPAGADSRVMRAEIYEMFGGRLPPGVVVGHAALVADAALFQARFYAGLFCEVAGDAEAAAEHLRVAASERFAGAGGFMNVVARVHWARVRDRVRPGS